MFENVKNVEIYSVSNMTTTVKNTSHTSLHYGFCIRTGGVAEYNYAGKIITTMPGDMIFKPKGQTYTFNRKSDEACTSTCIFFDADIENPQPEVYQLNDFSEKIYILSQIAKLWALGGTYEKYKCMSLFYSLLSYVSKNEYEKEAGNDSLILRPAEDYLQEHIFDSSLKVDKLYTLCGVSDTYFRKLFIRKYGNTPRKYIIDKRISYAKTLLEDNPLQSVKEVAFSVGFEDPLYFSRVFHKKYNIPPKNL